MRDLSREQIKTGLNKLAECGEAWPPNAIEFRKLCLPETISPDGKNSTAYIEFNDPRHPDYQPLRLESLTQRERRQKLGRETLNNLKSMF